MSGYLFYLRNLLHSIPARREGNSLQLLASPKIKSKKLLALRRSITLVYRPPVITSDNTFFEPLLEDPGDPYHRRIQPDFGGVNCAGSLPSGKPTT